MSQKLVLERPKSTTNLWVNFMGVGFFFLSIYLLSLIDPSASDVLKGIVGSLSTALPIALYETLISRNYKKPSAYLRAKNELNITRVGVKVLGLYGTFGVIGFFYWLFPEYRNDFFIPYKNTIFVALPLLMLLSLYYFIEIDLRMEKPEDGYWHMGQLMLLNFKVVNPRVLAEHYRAWTIKAFFLPLMYIYMIQDFNFLIGYNYSALTEHFLGFYDFLYTFIFTIDVAFASAGYMMTFRYMDWHIRSAEPTMLGWFVALVCYSPFWNGVFFNSYFSYNDGYYWGDMVRQYPVLMVGWGVAILVLVSIYSIATVALGCRFSNLTYRGLVTNGPYRFTKHPAYITKNLSWWLVSVPFIVHVDLATSFRNCVMLAGVNFIYFMRARTEENHLSNYPEYVQYANWINEHGVLRFLGDWIPFFKYSEERAKESGSVVWWKRVKGMDGY